MPRLRIACLLLIACSLNLVADIRAQPAGAGAPGRDIMPPYRWRQVQQSTDDGLAWLATQQQRDGSFKCTSLGQPGVTSLCVLAFLSNGHLPDEGPYGDTLSRAVDFVLRCQKPNGLISVQGPSGPIVPQPRSYAHNVGVAATYNHAISGLMLSEAYGMTGGGHREREIRGAIEDALRVTLKQQSWPKNHEANKGGLRYMHEFSVNADLSVVGWHLKLLRSAKNAGFGVPEQAINDAVGYVMRCYNRKYQTFEYEVTGEDRRTRAMAGVGILALAHSSRHNTPEAKAAADAVLKYSFRAYNRAHHFPGAKNTDDRYHYSVFFCSQAMYQMGGRHWAEFFPRTSKALVDHQNRDGSWAAERSHDQAYGKCYTTSLCVLALSAPNQMLPIYQR